MSDILDGLKVQSCQTRTTIFDTERYFLVEDVRTRLQELTDRAEKAEAKSDRYSKDASDSFEMRMEAEAEAKRLQIALETLIDVVGLTACKHDHQRQILQQAVDIGYKALNDTTEAEG